MWSRLGNERLSQIATRWSLIERAQAEAGDAARAAQLELLCRYGGAIYRYLLKAVREQEAVEDLCQELALRLSAGRFAGVDPQRGRFRDFLKGVLFHLISAHRRRQTAQPKQLSGSQYLLLNVPDPEPLPDEEFIRLWREELLQRAWEVLEAGQRLDGPPYYAALRCRVEHPDWDSDQVATRLMEQTTLPMTAVYVRQIIKRARTKFAAALQEEVKRSFAGASAEEVKEEMRVLGLDRYCLGDE